MARSTVLFLTLCLVTNVTVVDKTDLLYARITTQQKSISVGEPLFFELIYRFQNPKVLHQSNEVYTTIRHGAYVRIDDKAGKTLLPKSQLFPSFLHLRGSEGTEYSNRFLLLYDFFLRQKLIFDEPGVYTVYVSVSEEYTSDPLTITVERASNLEEKAISLISSPDTYALLEFGAFENVDTREKAMSDLTKIAETCGDALLAKWAATRLGLEYHKEFYEKKEGVDSIDLESPQVLNKSELLNKAAVYLSKGIGLPDGFPLREEALYKLCGIESTMGNSEKVSALLLELATKYPHGVYGKRAAKRMKANVVN